VLAGPRRRRSQACIVGGIEGDAISGVDWGGVWRKGVRVCFESSRGEQ